MASDRTTVPQDIITEVLYRLPAKSLGRFRCVSKHFLSLLSEPQFIKTHQNTINRKHFILDYKHNYLYHLPFNNNEESIVAPTEVSLNFNPHVDIYTFHGSCNGLVLVSGHDVDGGHTLIVLNPVTTESMALPESGYDIVDDMREIDIVFGFGYDSVSDDYKVVTISFFHDWPYEIAVHVYSLKTDTWRWVSDFPYDHTYGRSFPGVFVKGFLHWIAIKNDDDFRVIVAFSLEDETLSEVALPKSFNDADFLTKNEIELVSGEKLGVFMGVFMEGEVWLMNEYGVSESWTKIVLNGIDVGAMVQPVIFYENDKILVVTGDMMLVYGIEGRFCSCFDCKEFKIRGVCVESLVSPNFN